MRLVLAITMARTHEVRYCWFVSLIRTCNDRYTLAITFAAVVFSHISPVLSAQALQELPSQEIWSVAVSAAPAAPPSVLQPHVYVALSSGVVVAHQLEGGAVAWQRELRTDLPIEVAGDRVVLVSEETLYALSAIDGTTVWTAAVGTVTAPLLVQDGWIIAAGNGGLAAYRTSDGTRLWHRATGVQTLRATIEGDRLYVPLTTRLLSLELANGVTRWEAVLGEAPTEVLAFPDRLYAGSSNKFFYCFRARTGEVDWRAPVGLAVRGKPAADAAHVYTAGLDNTVRAFDRKNGALRWHKGAKFRPIAGPIGVGAAIIVAGRAAELMVLRADTGDPAARLALSQSLVMPPAFGTTDGDPVMAALTGDLSAQWKLTLLGPPRWTSPAVVPLTALPGDRVPIRLPGG